MTSTDTESPNGPAWAIVLAAGIGCASFGFFVDLAEASKAISNRLNLYSPAGDLSGKSTAAIIVWLIAWAILHVRWKNRSINSPALVSVVTVMLIVLAIIATFPPIIDLFATK
jgi:hypothetical protein